MFPGTTSAKAVMSVVFSMPPFPSMALVGDFGPLLWIAPLPKGTALSALDRIAGVSREASGSFLSGRPGLGSYDCGPQAVPRGRIWLMSGSIWIVAHVIDCADH